MCILNLDKVLMCKLHYDCIKNEYRKNWRLLFTDTDSLMFEHKTKDVYDNFSKDKEMFGSNNYSVT